MEKIKKSLRESAESDPDRLFNVLVVLREDANIKQIPLQDYNLVMENIASANIPGSKVIELSRLNAVKSIELDDDMSVL